MTQIISIKKYTDPKTKQTKFATIGLFADESTEPIGLFDTYAEAVELGRQLLGEQEKQSNEKHL